MNFEALLPKLHGPSYIYNQAELEEFITTLDHSDGVRLWYACKANPLSHLLEPIKKRGWGIDVASIGELDQALRVGFEPSKIIATGPAKSKEYLAFFLNKDVRHFVIESPRQLEDLSDLSSQMNITPKVLLRFQLNWEDSQKSVLGGDQITPFGLSIEDWTNYFETNSIKNLELLGAHVFQWGNVLEEEKLIQIWKRTCQDIHSFFQTQNWDLRVVDFGGGLGIDYTNQEKVVHWPTLASSLEGIRQEFGLDEVWLELGRYLMGRFGHYLCKVIDKKSVRGKEILVLEGGSHHMIRPALVNQGFPCSHTNEITKNGPTTNFQIHGPLCTALDCLGEFELPTNTNVGDWLNFSYAGAYGFTESMPFFLAHMGAAEIVWNGSDYIFARENQNPSEWMR